MIPSSVLPMIASSDDSTIAATRASAASVSLCVLTIAARSSVLMAIVPLTVWSSSSDSFCVYRTKGPEPLPARVAPERQTRHPDRRAHGRAAEAGERREREDVSRPIEDSPTVREALDEEGAEEPFERVAAGDPERRPDGSGRRDVHQKRAQEQRRPDTVPEQERGRQGDARRRPHRRRARMDQGERQPELPREEVDAGEHEEARRHERSERAYLEVLPRGCSVPGPGDPRGWRERHAPLPPHYTRTVSSAFRRRGWRPGPCRSRRPMRRRRRSRRARGPWWRRAPRCAGARSCSRPAPGSSL